MMKDVFQVDSAKVPTPPQPTCLFGQSLHTPTISSFGLLIFACLISFKGFIHILESKASSTGGLLFFQPHCPLQPTVFGRPFFGVALQVFYSNQFSRKASAPVVLLLGVAMFVYVSINLLIAEAKEGVA
jgi:hypothetical protein